jgi:hypothetical protein
MKDIEFVYKPGSFDDHTESEPSQERREAGADRLSACALAPTPTVNDGKTMRQPKQCSIVGEFYAGQKREGAETVDTGDSGIPLSF